ncbi:hypothetical protein GCM10022197_17200 [Microlunatus spumicola]|uniref:Uncharacterized protein n=1 Tax=Microlunatus spumicola TaxID=81499 RepID=A0ABP6X6C9_9ACTN
MTTQSVQAGPRAEQESQSTCRVLRWLIVVSPLVEPVSPAAVAVLWSAWPVTSPHVTGPPSHTLTTPTDTPGRLGA